MILLVGSFDLQNCLPVLAETLNPAPLLTGMHACHGHHEY